MEDKQEVVCDLSNCSIFNYHEWPWKVMSSTGHLCREGQYLKKHIISPGKVLNLGY